MTPRRTRVRPALLAVPLTLALSLAGCAGAPEPERKEAAGDAFPVRVSSCGFDATVTAPPERAVSMNQGATEVLLALDLADRMAGTAYLDDAVPATWQAAYDEVPVLSAAYPDNETLLAAEPDFVYASYLSAFDADAAGPREELADLGIASYASPFGCGKEHDRVEIAFDSVWDEIATVAAAFGVPDRAAAIEKEQQEALDALADRRPGAGRTVFWYDSGDKTAFAGAGQGGPQLILDAVGATNVFADLDGSWADVSWEQVVEADPDVIVLADASWSTADDKIAMLEKDPALKDLRAVRAEAYVVLPFSASTPGVRLADGAVSVGEQLSKLG
ncbi:ABC transporter substrate-binding protein [Nocardioides sp. LHD-245]|uniref:ABC transporter substrate-binding protein n=1 Tax=Nocardioides sp. LHD-245 TaxID=3051387 RepID=UPI0027DF9838|nr:ABC transporter substrate-binding protein [Nocardioides sp. LHD-245]